MLSISPPAAALVIRLAAELSLEPTLRVRVIGGGCNGLTWEFEVGAAERAGDHRRSADGVTVFVDPASAPYLRGGRVDLGPVKPNLLRHPITTPAGDLALMVAGPLPRGTCGCGESFSPA